MKSILNTIDIILGHLAAGIMTFLLYLSLGIVAALSLIAIPASFFEYGTGINELDLTEIGSLALLCLVVWRFYRRGTQLNWTWWQMIRRFVFAVSTVVLLASFIELIAMWMELTEKGRLEAEFLYRYEEIETFASCLLFILTIYAATPLSPFYKETQDSTLSAPSSIKEPIPETSSEPDATQSTDTGDFEENLKNYKAPENPWEKA
ncbi:hypothetical protein HWQ46_14720 [Shewanella sp. D64]|uniref:hypothetical protein n=1 Tax=unclassified Shewanella TaxID=196818 RepID=UPI0022BA39EE|nr:MULTISPECIES: hypothetical protein [unclassified Shewanella]MEC4726805.1 hypothetical protein [Shewanella sp. D64]MEC4739083.1 hypothetical protein [Shewanella sp. E94]WBJ95939.1 hypothetical protein HWQ47_02035 [Shewanella sp. MTB7]